MTERSAVQIAEVVSDLRAGRVRITPDRYKLAEHALRYVSGPVVDATTIYQSIIGSPKPVYIYEDHPNIAPPWDTAFVGYVNEFGNVAVMQAISEERFGKERTVEWDTDNVTDWTKVRWVTTVVVWVGGRSITYDQTIPTMGPLFMWRFAIYDNGEPADIQWTHLDTRHPVENWDMAQVVILGALNFMNCRNVDIVEPSRPRAEARRIIKTGVRVSVINVFPVGKSTRSTGNNTGLGVPLTSVRGHPAHYGPEYGKGLLFGKLAGRFWIPQHARGDKALGEVEHEYVLSDKEILMENEGTCECGDVFDEHKFKGPCTAPGCHCTEFNLDPGDEE